MNSAPSTPSVTFWVSPVAHRLLQQVHDLLVVVRNNLGTIGTLATLIVSDDSGKTEYQTLRQLALALQIGLHAGEVASLELREAC